MTRGVKGSTVPTSIPPEQARRQIFQIAVKAHLTAEDLAAVAEQVKQVGGLVGEWHALEAKILLELLASRNGASLVDLATAASEEAWQQVAANFETAFPKFKAQLVKGQVQVVEA